MIFSFITTTLHDAVDKNRQINITHILPLTIESWKTLIYDNLANPESSHDNSSSKVFWLTNFWVNNIHFIAHHKKPVKTNKNQSIMSKKFNVIFRGKKLLRITVILTRRCHSPRAEIKNLIGVKFKRSPGTINNLILPVR